MKLKIKKYIEIAIIKIRYMPGLFHCLKTFAIQILNSVGEIQQPCRKPLLITNFSDNLLPILTCDVDSSLER